MKLIIFDLDGVIVDTAKFHYKSWKSMANDLGIDFTEEQNELLKGVSRKRSLEIILEIGNLSLSDKDKVEYMRKKNEMYLSYVHTMSREEILPGIMELLNEIREKKIYCALGSASKNARTILEKLDLMESFNIIVDGTDVKKAKPDPQVFISSADQLSIPYSETVVIEDSISGIRAANSVGMFSVGVGSYDTLSEAKWVVPNFESVGLDDLKRNYLGTKIFD